MKIKIFDRKKYIESINKLKERKAPGYVIRAYREGYAGVVREYYRLKAQERLGSKIFVDDKDFGTISEAVTVINQGYLKEALDNKDLAFLKAFFRMTNMDILTGEKIPPSASALIKQGITKSSGLKDLFKKMI